MEVKITRSKAKIGLLLLASTGFTGAVAGNTVPHYAAIVNGVGCWDLSVYVQFHRAKNKQELLTDNPLVCQIASPGSRQGWSWASPCSGCLEIHGSADVVPAGSFLDPTLIWYVHLSDGDNVYAVGSIQQFDAGPRLVKLWISGRYIRRKDDKPLPANPTK